MTNKYKVGDRVWTGAFYRGAKNELKVSIFEREIVSIMPNYLNKRGNFRYGLVSVHKMQNIRDTMKQTGEPLSMFGCAYKPEALFDYEMDARTHVQAKIIQELAAIRELLGEIPTLKTGEIHTRKP